jgi:hypothetical protein
MPLKATQRVLFAIIIFAIPAIVLTVIGYMAAGLFNHSNLYLIAVYPSTIPGQAHAPAENGPTVLLGVFGMKIRILSSINL